MTIYTRAAQKIGKEFNKDDIKAWGLLKPLPGPAVSDITETAAAHCPGWGYETIVGSNPNNAVIYLNEYLFARETGAVVNFDKSKIEIEHIMPASGKNIATIREDANMSEDEFIQYVNKLGNKILLEQPINAVIGRDWFITKKQKSVQDKRGYKDSTFPIAQSLTSYPKDRWEKEDIDKATQKAAKRIAGYIFD